MRTKCKHCEDRIAVSGELCIECRDEQLDENGASIGPVRKLLAGREGSRRTASHKVSGGGGTGHGHASGFGEPANVALDRIMREDDAKRGIYHHPGLKVRAFA